MFAARRLTTFRERNEGAGFVPNLARAEARTALFVPDPLEAPLKEQGLITESEYAEKRGKILAEL